MSTNDTISDTFDPVPPEVIPPGTLPPMRYRDLPKPVSLRLMLGPGIILAGMALGSGEYVIWPYITYQTQFTFFWACVVGVTMQYFINMEVTRWTLATGETVTTGFCRMGRIWPWIFIVMNVVPWIMPAWATGAARMTGWLIWGPEVSDQTVQVIAVAGLVMCGAILTAGPVVYETVEKMQFVLVSLVLLLVVGLAIWLLKDRPDAIAAQAKATVTLGAPDFIPPLDTALLLGALAFAGAGGTLNLAQSSYVKDKGYGMGAYIGRITSPITGRAEPISEVGFHFPDTEENRKRWKVWWKNASLEHFFSFYVTCLVCLVLLTLIAYSLFYGPDGNALANTEYERGFSFILGEADSLQQLMGPAAKTTFLLIGIVILLTTEFGILDAITRISADIVKAAWLPTNETWTASRLYYAFLWGIIGLGVVVLLQGQEDTLGKFKIASAMNGGVMFIYSVTLIYVNRRMLPPSIRMPVWRMAVMVLVVLFFGFFSVLAVRDVCVATAAWFSG